MARKRYTVEAIVRMLREAEVEKAGDQRTNVLPLAEGVRWSSYGPGPPSEGIRTGECAPEESGGWAGHNSISRETLRQCYHVTK